MRTVSAFALKDAPIGQIISERKFYYAMTEECDVFYATPYDVAYMYDHIGNVIGLAEMSAGGASVLEAYDMEAFGRVMDGSQDGVHLTTKEYHPENGLYYFGARWHDPAAGRWIEKEPFGLDGPNLYHFVFANPVINYDLGGWATFTSGGGISGGFGGWVGGIECGIVTDESGSIGLYGSVTLGGGVSWPASLGAYSSVGAG